MKNTTTPQGPPASDPRPQSASDSGKASTQSRPKRRRGSPASNAHAPVIAHMDELKSSGFEHKQASAIAKVSYDAIAESVGPIRNELDDVKHDLEDVKITQAEHGVQISALTNAVRDLKNTLTSEVRDLKKDNSGLQQDISRKFIQVIAVFLLVAGGVTQIYFYHIDPKLDRVSALSENVKHLDEKVGHLDKKVGHLDKKVERLDEKVGHLDKKVERLDGKVDRLEKKFDRLDEKIERLAVAIEQIAAAKGKGAKPALAPGREGAKVDSPGRGPGSAAPAGRKAPSRQDSASASAKGAGRSDGGSGQWPGQGRGTEAAGDGRPSASPGVSERLARATGREMAVAPRRSLAAKPGLCALAPARGWRDEAGAQPPSGGAALALAKPPLAQPPPRTEYDDHYAQTAKPPLAQPPPSLSRRWGWLDGTAALARPPASMPSAALAAARAPCPLPGIAPAAALEPTPRP